MPETRRTIMRTAALGLGAALAGHALGQASEAPAQLEALSPKQQAIAPITAAAALGDMPRLHAALRQGLDAGLAISELKEMLIQLYAYAGFPRSLNALGELMQVLQARRQQGLQDTPGRDPVAPVPTGGDLLALGTANQTALLGGPVAGPLFAFAPAIDTFLKTHLFGDIFARDNLDWPSRELATLGMLAALQGVDSQLQAHVRISMHVGLTAGQLRQLADGLAQRGWPEAAQRVREALDRQLADAVKRWPGGSNTMKGIAMNASIVRRSRRWRQAAGLGLAAALAMGGAGSVAARDFRHQQVETGLQAKARMWMTIGGTHRVAVTLENNPTAQAFAQMLPLTLDMPDLNDNEKHVRLQRSLPTNAERPGTIRTGDVMLYGSDTLVVFYRSFPSSYSYTRIGRVTEVEGLAQALGTGSQRIVFAPD